MFAVSEVQQIAGWAMVGRGVCVCTCRMGRSMRRARRTESARVALDEIAEDAFVVLAGEVLFEEPQRFAHDQRSIRLRPPGALEYVRQAVGFAGFVFVELTATTRMFPDCVWALPACLSARAVRHERR